MEMELGGICRTCLRRGQPVWPLFDENQELFTAGTPLVDFLNMFTEIMIFRMEGFPDQVCTNCLNDLKRAYAFKLRCECSETTLYHLKETNGILNLDDFNFEMDFIKATQQSSLSPNKADDNYMDTGCEVNDMDIPNRIYDLLQIETVEGNEELDLNLKPELDANLEQQMFFKSRLQSASLNGDRSHDYDREESNEEEFGNVLVCSACPENFRNRDLLKTHVIDYHTDGNLCILCNEEFDCIRMHTDKHLLPRLQCSHCDQKFEYRPLLNAHLRTHMIKNKETGRMEFKCERCRKTFASHHEFMIHQRIHSEDRPFSCETCGMAFKRRDKLKAHMTSHSDERPFECSLCQSRFKRKDNLSSHMKSVHQQGDKIFKCDVCDKAFRFKDKLKAHMNTHLRLFSCELCHAGFPRKESLDRHIDQKHRGSDNVAGGVAMVMPKAKDANPVKAVGSQETKLLQCSVCQKEFTQQEALSNHVKTHVKKVELKCELCLKVFSQSNKLKSHMITHTDLRPFQCTFCPSVFKRKDNLNRHMKKHNRSKVVNKTQCNSSSTSCSDKVEEDCAIKCDDNRVQQNVGDCDNTTSNAITDVSQLNKNRKVDGVHPDARILGSNADEENEIRSEVQTNSLGQVSQDPNDGASTEVQKIRYSDVTDITKDNSNQLVTKPERQAFECLASMPMDSSEACVPIEEQNGPTNVHINLSATIEDHHNHKSNINNESFNGILSDISTTLGSSKRSSIENRITEQPHVIAKNPTPSDSYTIASLLSRKDKSSDHKNNVNAIVVSLSSGSSNSASYLNASIEKTAQIVNNIPKSQNHSTNYHPQIEEKASPTYLNNHSNDPPDYPHNNHFSIHNNSHDTHHPSMNRSDTICIKNVESA